MLSRRVARRRLEAGEQQSYLLWALQSFFRLVACTAAQLPTQLRATLELYFAGQRAEYKPCSNQRITSGSKPRGHARRHTRINCIPRATATRLQDEDERRCRPARSRNLQPPLHKTPRRGRERCRPARSRNLQPPLHCAPLGVGVSLCCLPLLRHIGGSPATP